MYRSARRGDYGKYSGDCGRSQGDISNLLPTFPEFLGEVFRPWINEDDAGKMGATPDEFAEKTVKMWECMQI